ncbi:MAG: DNA/RNA nuclease SfsA [Sulfolobales archaeon]
MKEDLLIMKIESLIDGVIIRRVNRFIVEISRNRESILAHNTNTGRLLDFIRPGRRALLKMINGEKIKYRLIAIEDLEGSFSIVDTLTQGIVFEELVRRGFIYYLRGCRISRRNPRAIDSVLDYQIECDNNTIYVETKSAVFRGPEGEAMYPDAPTKRGERHVKTLIELKDKGFDTALIFIAAMKNVKCFKPFEEVDPLLSNLIYQALKKNVLVKSLSIYMREDGSIYLENPDIPLCTNWIESMRRREFEEI